MPKILIAFAAMLALSAVACSKSSSTGGTTAPACTSANATDLSGDDPFTVTIQNLAFQPNCFTAKSSASITIENKDAVTHTFTIDGTSVNATINANSTFNGESAGLAPGTYPFHCTIHTQMTGTVIVT